MPVYPHLFTLTARTGIRSVGTRDWGTVTFRRITEDSAKQYWLSGFPYLHITAAGARHYFAEATLDERKQLLELCRTPQEVLAIRDIKQGKAIDKAAEARLRALGEEPPAPAPAPAPEQEPPAPPAVADEPPASETEPT